MEDQKRQPSNSGGGNKPSMNFYWIYGVIGVMLLAMLMLNTSEGGSEIQWTEFKQKIEDGQVKRLVFDGQRASVYLKDEVRQSLEEGQDEEGLLKTVYQGADYWLNVPAGDAYLEDLKTMSESYDFTYVYEPVNEWGQQMLTYVVFFALMIGVWVLLMRRLGGGGGGGGQIFNIGKSKAQLFEKGKGTDVNFGDVAGLDGAKEELEEIVAFLKAPEKYTNLGAKIPKGALLVGPPGTGKTLLAKAVAGEAQVPFFSLSGSDFVEMFVGVGASRVRDLFKQAKEKAPAIVFIDEIDAIGRARGKNASMGSNDERENTLNQLLTEMDGFGTNSGVIILAATNRADILDKALMRAGRFDRQIYVDMPDLTERKAIFDVHLRPIKVDESIDIDFLSRQTPGFSGADIANVCNEAALYAARKGRDQVIHQDFLDAVDRIIGGLEKRTKIISEEEKRTIAFHEAGHAVVSWLVEFASPLVKVSIVPRGQSLGAAWYLPEERQITTTEQMLDEMCAALGGRAAEDLVFNKISTGALSDLEKVTKQAYAMVSVYGLNERIGNRSYYDSRGDQMFTKPYSEETSRIIDEEVGKIIEGAYDRAKEILQSNFVKLSALADSLLTNEVIFREDVERILGARPFQKPETALPSPEAPAAPEATGAAEEKTEDAPAPESGEE
ncbi:MAG: ATP-dependent metallopeptidase FtsH/Yme1/Tma family protein [Crocinitomicaceae bacterium TMED209]|nr:MAG: ATP-dependent metallopeptidase FtsH/Yme1/Tma family protein [Crocinitomicaceae bacterium TMED209]|tara:strand:+ start:1522 stop:3525 length:2004 start_codon:yes stop_codon:yes gene_type:complete